MLNEWMSNCWLILCFIVPFTKVCIAAGTVLVAWGFFFASFCSFFELRGWQKLWGFALLVTTALIGGWVPIIFRWAVHT